MTGCNRKGCENAGVYRVGFTFRPLDRRPPIPVESSLIVCDDHRQAMTLGDFLTGEMREMSEAVMRVLGGTVDPDGYRLTFAPVQ